MRTLRPKTRLVPLLLVMLGAVLGGCSDSGAVLPPVTDPIALTPPPGFASGDVLVVSSEGTTESLAVLSLDPATGQVGLLAGSPANVGVQISDAETLAADPARRRIFFGSNLTRRIAVLDLDGAGRPVPVFGSPFLAQFQPVSVIKVSPAGDMIYVGYHDHSTISRYSVDAAGALTLAQSIVTPSGNHVETMLQVGDVLYVGFETTSNIVGFQLDAQGAFVVNGMGDPTEVAVVSTNIRPDYLVAIADKLYCSLAQAGSVDAFQIEASGALTRLAGSPYAFPGMGLFELITVQPGGALIAVGGERPTATVGLYTVNGDGTLTPAGAPLAMHERGGGPEGMVFSADGRFLYVSDHIGQGLYVFEVTGNTIDFAATPRYMLPGRQIDVIRLALNVNP